MEKVSSILQTPTDKVNLGITSPEIYLPGMTNPSHKKSLRTANNKRPTTSDDPSTTSSVSESNKRVVLGTSARKSARTFVTRQPYEDQENTPPPHSNRTGSRSTYYTSLPYSPKVDIEAEHRRPVKELKSWLMDFEKKQKTSNTPMKPLSVNQTIVNSNVKAPRRSPKMLVNEERKSVTELKGWLVDFEENQKRNGQVGNANAVKPSMNTKSTMSCTPMKQVQNSTSKTKVGSKIGPPTPLSSVVKEECLKTSTITKPASYVIPSVQRPAKIPKDEVQATDEGYASVSKVSAWLANDAFNTKKDRMIRKDPNVYNKGLKFGDQKPSDEAGENVKKNFLEEIASAEQRVSDRAQWLKNSAFSGKQPTSIIGATPSFTHNKPKEQKPSQPDIISKDNNIVSNISDKIPSFEERRKLLIQRELQASKYKSEKVPAYQIKWETAGSTGQYSKKFVNKIGVAPKKSFAELP